MNQFAFSCQYKYIELYFQEQFKTYSNKIENLLNQKFDQILNVVSRLENTQQQYSKYENSLIKSIEQIILKVFENQFMDIDQQAEKILELISQQTTNNFQNEISLNEFRPPEVNQIVNTKQDHQYFKFPLDNMDKQLIEILDRITQIEKLEKQIYDQLSIKTNQQANLAVNDSRNDQPQQFFITKSGTKFHREGCENLKRSKLPYFPEIHKNFDRCQNCL